jgi:NitT/TauT family transport system permease protein
MKPLQPVNPGTRVVLGVSFFILFFALWAAVTFGGLVSKTFLADPWTMVKSGYDAADVNSGLQRGTSP